MVRRRRLLRLLGRRPLRRRRGRLLCRASQIRSTCRRHSWRPTITSSSNSNKTKRCCSGETRWPPRRCSRSGRRCRASSGSSLPCRLPTAARRRPRRRRSSRRDRRFPRRRRRRQIFNVFRRSSFPARRPLPVGRSSGRRRRRFRRVFPPDPNGRVRRRRRDVPRMISLRPGMPRSTRNSSYQMTIPFPGFQISRHYFLNRQRINV